MGFYKYCIGTQKSGYRLFHYIDKPDMNMNELVEQVEKSLNKKLPAVRANITGKNFSVSAIRVKKFCLPALEGLPRSEERTYRGATTQFDATANSVPEPVEGKAPFTLSEGLHRTLHYEFMDKEKDEVVFESE